MFDAITAMRLRHTTPLRNAGIALVTAVLTACAPVADRFARIDTGYVENPGAVVAAADWSRAQTVEVELDEFSFAPETLDLRAGVPYRLVLRNGGSGGHTFVSDGFFRSIAVRRLAGPGSEISQPRLQTIAVAPETERVLEFVSVRAGDYPLECTLPLHASFGMTGTIRVSPD